MASAHSSFGFSVNFIYFFLARYVPVVKGVKNGPVTWGPCIAACGGEHPSSCRPCGQAAGGLLCVLHQTPEGTHCTHMPQPGTCLYNHRRQSSVLCVCSWDGSLVFIIISSSVLVHSQWQGPYLIRHISVLEATWDCGNTWHVRQKT